MKRYVHILIALLLMWVLTGCGESSKKPQTDTEPVVTAQDRDGQTTGDTAAEDMGEMSADDEFDLLDEGLEEDMIVIADPLEGVNRFFFEFNDMVYVLVLDPVSRTYEGIVCEPWRIGIDNFFQNLTTPARYANCLLQGKGDGADIELRRFWINTTEGILGFGDPALEKHGLEQVKEDLGQTLAVWGIGDGFYIVWPILGPSTLRDSVGMVGDQFLNPVRYVQPVEVAVGASALKFINKSSFHTGEYEALVGDAVDPYIMVRQSYMQYRAKLIEE